jgi:hypothetical protein
MNGDGNRWNRFRYSLWAPAYDLVGRRFDLQRREALGLLNVKPGERVLLVGAGAPDGARLTWVYVSDPEGNVLELQSRPK